MAFRSLAEKAAVQLYGKQSSLAVTVQGSPKAGSFEIGLVLDRTGQNPGDAAPVGTYAEATIVGTVKGVISLASWAKGKFLSIVGKNGEQCQVRNVDYEEKLFNPVIVTITIREVDCNGPYPAHVRVSGFQTQTPPISCNQPVES